MTSSGAFDTPVVQYSEKTKTFIKELIRESRVNIHYQRRIEKALDRNVPLKQVLLDSRPEKTPPGGEAVHYDESHVLKAIWKSKRSKEAIKKLVKNSKEELFVPKPPKYDQASKERCQDLMTNSGEKLLRTEKLKLKSEENLGEGNDYFSEENRRKQLIEEIEERLHWLSAMDELGAGNEYKDLMHSQIAIRIRDIEFMDETLANMGKKST